MSQEKGHRALEGKATLFAILSLAAIAVGSVVELAPMFTIYAEGDRAIAAGIEPYTPLEVAGRDIYVREGCYVCHSQMIRPMRAEVMRYGEWSRSVEYAWDRPFQLGSRRIGPDLMREGGNRSDDWHYEHMRDPRKTSPRSVMPPYQWLLEWELDPADTQASVRALQRLGHPYTDTQVAGVPAQMQAQGAEIVARLAEKGIQTDANREIIAVIAYMQRLGTSGDAMLRGAADAGGGQ